MRFFVLEHHVSKARPIILLSAVFLTSACQATEQIKENVNQVSESAKPGLVQTADCPLISSQNWSAEITQNQTGNSVLSITGDVELPNPGYSIVFEEGIADKSLMPRQHFTIKTERLSGFYVQAVTALTLEHTAPAIAKHYRSIVIHCGQQTIATINNVVQAGE